MHDAGIRAVRDVWRINAAKPLASNIDNLVIDEHTRRTICHIRNRHSATNCAVHQLGVR